MSRRKRIAFVLHDDITQLVFHAHHDSGRKRRSCVASHLLRVDLTERALCLNDCAPEARYRLSQCAPEKTLYCSSGRSLRAATPNRAADRTSRRRGRHRCARAPCPGGGPGIARHDGPACYTGPVAAQNPAADVLISGGRHDRRRRFHAKMAAQRMEGNCTSTSALGAKLTRQGLAEGFMRERSRRGHRSLAQGTRGRNPSRSLSSASSRRHAGTAISRAVAALEDRLATGS
jgi:hypothetical protein